MFEISESNKILCVEFYYKTLVAEETNFKTEDSAEMLDLAEMQDLVEMLDLAEMQDLVVMRDSAEMGG